MAKRTINNYNNDRGSLTITFPGRNLLEELIELSIINNGNISTYSLGDRVKFHSCQVKIPFISKNRIKLIFFANNINLLKDIGINNIKY